jgi:ABC-type glycerol-3-phosphate transport system substrate-binding protein
MKVKTRHCAMTALAALSIGVACGGASTARASDADESVAFVQENLDSNIEGRAKECRENG